MQYGSTALHYAASGGHSSIVEALVAAGADVGAVDRVRLGNRIHVFRC